MMSLEIGTLVIAILLVVIAAVYIFATPAADPKPYGILAVAAIFLFANKLFLGMYAFALFDIGLFVWNAYLFITMS